MTEWQTGINAFHEGRLREAADRLRAAAADHEHAVTQAARFHTLTYLGAALYALGNATGAAEAFADAVKLHINEPVPPALRINLANAYIASGNRQQAQETLAQALQDHPGAMEARTLWERLQNWDKNLPLTGSVFGETPESVQRYMATLSFSTTDQGYSPEQVKASLAQITQYVNFLSAHLAERDHVIAQNAAEIDRLRQSEETLISNLVQLRQELDQIRSSDGTVITKTGREQETEDGGRPDLTPLEKLFQKKN